jgi:hypothetical protein
VVDRLFRAFGGRARHACVVQIFFDDSGGVPAILGEGKRVATGATGSHRAHYRQIYPGGPKIRRGRCRRCTYSRVFGVVACER